MTDIYTSSSLLTWQETWHGVKMTIRCRKQTDYRGREELKITAKLNGKPFPYPTIDRNKNMPGRFVEIVSKMRVEAYRIGNTK